MCALRTAADFTGAPAFALSPSPRLPLPLLLSQAPPGAPAGGAPVQVISDRSLGEGTLRLGVVIADGRASVVGQGGGGVGGHGAGAGAHGFGDHLEFVGAGAVVLLLVLHAVVVLEEELAGLLQHPAALADGAAGQRAGDYTQRPHSAQQHGVWRLTPSCGSC